MAANVPENALRNTEPLLHALLGYGLSSPVTMGA